MVKRSSRKKRRHSISPACSFSNAVLGWGRKLRKLLVFLRLRCKNQGADSFSGWKVVSPHKRRSEFMRKRLLTMFGLVLALMVLTGLVTRYGLRSAQATTSEANSAPEEMYSEPVVSENGLSVEVLVDGRPVNEYAARGRRYVEALENAEYELQIHNPLGTREAVALSVDGLNTIDARHTSSWEAHKWVIEPYGTIHVRGWQMSSENARRFYFTTERDSYGAKLGQTANLGVISAVFFRERKPFSIMPIVPRPPKEDGRIRSDRTAPESSTSGQSSSKTDNRSEIGRASCRERG